MRRLFPQPARGLDECRSSACNEPLTNLGRRRRRWLTFHFDGANNPSLRARRQASLDQRLTAAPFGCKSEPRGTTILTNLVVPKTGGMNTTKVNVVRWLKNEGDSLQQG